MKLLVSIVFSLLLASHSHGSDCPSIGPLTEKKHIAEFGLSFMHPKGFLPVEMNTPIAYISIISRSFYEKGKATPNTVRIEFQVNKRLSFDKKQLENILKMREKEDKYTNIGTINAKGEKLPIYEWSSKSGEEKYVGLYYPLKDGKYAQVQLTPSTNKGDDFHKRCLESFNTLAKAIIQSIE